MRKLRLNPLNPPALHMNEFLEVMDHKINLSGHKSPARASLPFFINLDVEVEKEWKSYFSRILRFQHTSYADIEVRENGYEGMPPVQEMIASLSRCGRDILSQGSLLAI